MLTVNDIFAIDTLTTGLRGAAEARLREYRTAQNRGGGPSVDRTAGYGPAQLQWLKAVRDAATPRQPRTRLVHPADIARTGGSAGAGRLGEAALDRRHGTGSDTGPRDLSATEIAWLERLPTNPAAVTFEDAVELARLMLVVTQSQSHSSRLLVESLWEPVRLIHDERVAQNDLEREKRPTAISAAAVDAAAEVLQRDNPGMPADEARWSAQEKANQYEASQLSEHERKRAKAQKRITTARERMAERAATTRSIAG